MQLRGGRARSGPEFFGMWLYDKETEVGRDVSFWGAKHTELSNRAGSGGLPRRRSPALHFGAPGARQGQVSLDARPGRSRRRQLPARNRVLECNSNVVGVLVHRPKKRVPLDS